MAMQRRMLSVLCVGLVVALMGLHSEAQNDDEASGFYGEAGVSLLQPGEVNDIDYANKSSSGINKGDFENVEFDFGGAYFLQVGQRTSSGTEWGLRFWTGNFEDDDSVTGSGNVDSLIAHGENTSSNDNDRITAEQEIDIKRFDLSVRTPLKKKGNLNVNGSFGLNLSTLDTELNSQAFNGGSQVWFVNSETDNFMFGPRVGASAEYEIASNFDIGISSGISMLVNNQESELQEGPSSVSEPRDLEDDGTGVTPAFDMKLGATYQPIKKLTIGLGFDFMWFREVSTYHHGPDDVNDPISIERSNDLSLHGLTLDVSYVF